MKERLIQPFNGEKEGGSPDLRVCAYCANHTSDACPACMEEGKYRALAPARLPHWELPPELPPFKELLEMPAAARLAFVYLGLYYLREERTRE